MGEQCSLPNASHVRWWPRQLYVRSGQPMHLSRVGRLLNACRCLGATWPASASMLRMLCGAGTWGAWRWTPRPLPSLDQRSLPGEGGCPAKPWRAADMHGSRVCGQQGQPPCHRTSPVTHHIARPALPAPQVGQGHCRRLPVPRQGLWLVPLALLPGVGGRQWSACVLPSQRLQGVAPVCLAWFTGVVNTRSSSSPFNRPSQPAAPTPSQVSALPAEARSLLPPALQAQPQAYVRLGSTCPPAVEDACWRAFHAACEPLYRASRLGCILFQFHLSFQPSQANLEVCGCLGGGEGRAEAAPCMACAALAVAAVHRGPLACSVALSGLAR